MILSPTTQPVPFCSAVEELENDLQPVYTQSSKNAEIGNVLLVEPDEAVAHEIATGLESLGVWVEPVSTASDAYQRFSHRHRDLVIANVDLPDESGWLLAAKLSITNPVSRVWLFTSEQTVPCGESPSLGQELAGQLRVSRADRTPPSMEDLQQRVELVSADRFVFGTTELYRLTTRWCLLSTDQPNTLFQGNERCT